MRKIFRFGASLKTNWQPLRFEKLASIQQVQHLASDSTSNLSNCQSSQHQSNPAVNHLTKLNQYMDYHKFSKAIKEIDRLAMAKVELPIQDILNQFVRNSEFDLTNKLYDILQKSSISINDISYIYLIDANLKDKNIQNAMNILIHAYLSGVILDIEAYRGIFNSLPKEMDKSYLFVLYKLYREHFHLTSKTFYELALQAEEFKDTELSQLLEDDAINQGIAMPENLKKMFNKSIAPKQFKNPKSKEDTNQDKEDFDEVNKDVSPGLERAFGNNSQPFISDELMESILGNEGSSMNKNQPFQYQSLDQAGGQVLRFIKKGQKEGDLEDEDFLGERGEDQGEGLNSYSDEDSD